MEIAVQVHFKIFEQIFLKDVLIFTKFNLGKNLETYNILSKVTNENKTIN